MKTGKFKIKMPADVVSREGPPSDLYMAIFLLCPLMAERALVSSSSYRALIHYAGSTHMNIIPDEGFKLPVWGGHIHSVHSSVDS